MNPNGLSKHMPSLVIFSSLASDVQPPKTLSLTIFLEDYFREAVSFNLLISECTNEEHRKIY